MRLKAAEERLQNYVRDGIAAEIFRADQAYSVAEEIGKHAEQINAANFGELFGSLQLTLSDRHTLSVVKIFDPAKRYPTRSIPGTLAILQSEAKSWTVPEPLSLRRVLIDAGLNSSNVERMNNVELTHAVVTHFRGTLPDPKRLNPDNLSLS